MSVDKETKAKSVPTSLKNHHLDGTDYAILRLMQENNNRTYTTISTLLVKEGIELKGPAVGNRIDALRQNGFIKKDVSILDYKKFSVGQTYFMKVIIPDKSGTHYDDFIIAAAKEPDIIEVHEIAGEFDCLLKVVVTDLEEALEISKRLARLGAKLETLGVSKSPKLSTAIRVPHPEKP